jgi:hypothetical protein
VKQAPILQAAKLLFTAWNPKLRQMERASSGSLLEFVEQCERHWKIQFEPLTPEQLEWLAWVKETAATASTFPADFPDPTKDGGFDPNSIPLGGPYPKARKLDD